MTIKKLLGKLVYLIWLISGGVGIGIALSSASRWGDLNFPDPLGSWAEMAIVGFFTLGMFYRVTRIRPLVEMQQEQRSIQRDIGIILLIMIPVTWAYQYCFYRVWLHGTTVVVALLSVFYLWHSRREKTKKILKSTAKP